MHGDSEGTSSTLNVFANIFISFIGSGVLGLPFAFKEVSLGSNLKSPTGRTHRLAERWYYDSPQILTSCLPDSRPPGRVCMGTPERCSCVGI